MSIKSTKVFSDKPYLPCLKIRNDLRYETEHFIVMFFEGRNPSGVVVFVSEGYTNKFLGQLISDDPNNYVDYTGTVVLKNDF